MTWHPITPLEPPIAVAMQQHPAYGAAVARGGGQVRWWGLSNGAAPQASAQVLTRHWPGLGRVALISRGPVCWGDVSQTRALAQLVATLRDTHAGVIVTPEHATPLPGLLPLMTPLHVAELDLTPSPDALRARLHGKWRNRLVRAEEAGMTVDISPLPADAGHWLLRAEAAQARTRRYRRLPPAFTAGWAAANPEGAWLLSARRGSDVLGGIILLRHGAAASYHIAWVSEAGRKAGAAPLLLWRAMLWLRERGTRRLDLDAIETETNPGLARFKLGTGATARALGATVIAAPGTSLIARLTARKNRRAAALPR